MTIEEMRSEVSRIQQCWRLKDWDVKIEIIPSEETPKTFGCIEWTPENKKATISISDKCPAVDHLGTIWHELGHLLFQGHKNCPGRYDTHLEFALNMISSDWQRK